MKIRASLLGVFSCWFVLIRGFSSYFGFGIADDRGSLERQSQRELDLPVRSQAYRPFDRLPELPEGRSGKRLCVGLAGLESRCQNCRQRGGRVGKIRRVEDIEDLLEDLKQALG